jgi:hypothetical protein
MPASDRRSVSFRRVSIRNLTGSGAVTIRIIKVNGIDIKDFALTGYMRVLTQAEHAALPENRGR